MSRLHFERTPLLGRYVVTEYDAAGELIESIPAHGTISELDAIRLMREIAEVLFEDRKKLEESAK